jgi:hypothetical protein
MKIRLTEVAKGSALPTTSVTFSSGKAVLIEAETERRPTVLSLIASGRMRPDSGTVTIDGKIDYGRMRAAIALVDAPGVSEPASDVTLSGVVAEELMFAGKPVRPSSVRQTLAQLGASQYAKTALADVPPTLRIRILCELALCRPGVQGVVLTSPDRHGGEPTEWWDFANEMAERGHAVLVVTGREVAAALPPKKRKKNEKKKRAAKTGKKSS